MRTAEESVAPDLVWLFDVLWGGVEGARRTPGPTASGPGYPAIRAHGAHEPSCPESRSPPVRR